MGEAGVMNAAPTTGPFGGRVPSQCPIPLAESLTAVLYSHQKHFVNTHSCDGASVQFVDTSGGVATDEATSVGQRR